MRGAPPPRRRLRARRGVKAVGAPLQDFLRRPVGAVEPHRLASNKRPAPGAPVLQVLQPKDGGVAAHVLALAEGLTRRGWRIEVATPATSSIRGALRDAGIPVHELPLVRDPGRSDLAAARILRALDRERGYGLVHGHSSKAGALVRAAMPAIRAAARLRSSGRLPGRLAIVGNGPLEGEVRDEIDRLGVHEHVRWFPYGGAVGPHLAALDLFVLPSAWEALPLSLLEAMSCSLPILATDVGGTPEVVEDGVTGRIVPHGDELELAVGLLELLTDPALRARLGEAGRRTYEARFRLGRMLDETEALYRELLGVTDVPAPAMVATGNGRLRVT